MRPSQVVAGSVTSSARAINSFSGKLADPSELGKSSLTIVSEERTASSPRSRSRLGSSSLPSQSIPKAVPNRVIAPRKPASSAGDQRQSLRRGRLGWGKFVDSEATLSGSSDRSPAASLASKRATEVPWSSQFGANWNCNLLNGWGSGMRDMAPNLTTPCAIVSQLWRPRL